MLVADANLIYSLNLKLGHSAPLSCNSITSKQYFRPVDLAVVQSNGMENKKEFTLLLQLEAY